MASVGVSAVNGTVPLVVSHNPYATVHHGQTLPYRGEQYTPEMLKSLIDNFGEKSVNRFIVNRQNMAPIHQGPFATSHGLPDILYDDATYEKLTEPMIERYISNKAPQRRLFPLELVDRMQHFVIMKGIIPGRARNTPEHAPSTGVADTVRTLNYSLIRIAKHYIMNANAMNVPAEFNDEIERKKNAVVISFLERETEMVMECLMTDATTFEQRYARMTGIDNRELDENQRVVELHKIHCRLAFAFDRTSYALQTIMNAAVAPGIINSKRTMLVTETGAVPAQMNTQKESLEWYLSGVPKQQRYETEMTFFAEDGSGKKLNLITMNPQIDVNYELAEQRLLQNGGFRETMRMSLWYTELKTDDKIGDFAKGQFVPVGRDVAKGKALIRCNMSLSFIGGALVNEPDGGAIGRVPYGFMNSTVSHDGPTQMIQVDNDMYLTAVLGYPEAISLLPPLKMLQLVGRGGYADQNKIKDVNSVADLDPNTPFIEAQYGQAFDDKGTYFYEIDGYLMKTKLALETEQGTTPLGNFLKRLAVPISMGTVYNEDKTVKKATGNSALGGDDHDGLDTKERIGHVRMPINAPPNYMQGSK